MKRRAFLGLGAASGASLILPTSCASPASNQKVSNQVNGPFVISTWNPAAANAAAWEGLKDDGYVLDAIEAGIRIEEENPNNTTVGIGGAPDRDGHVTLDACIMNEKGDAGSVVFLEDVVYPISVARQVMENSPHVILAGQGAQQFAFNNGFAKTNLLTEKSKEAWAKWLVKAEYQPIINIEMHDTIGMIAKDAQGRISGGCSTSGLAYKMRGRVGDSPIIGSGLFVDGEVGAATATGLGEEVIKTVGSFLMVELMRQGYSPQAAAEEAIGRIVAKKGGEKPNFQVGYICFNTKGEIGAYSIHPGFGYVLNSETDNGYIAADSFFKKE
ncbi:MAG: N(4)-(beta-N-acetylglucosaminyl)-L-asparaginase [Saprospiraceae bacterium]|nr:N(4)-(beta-N-acetylglucosaminyl)-L-asparaginase [Saprospiraceae bacterium]